MAPSSAAPSPEAIAIVTDVITNWVSRSYPGSAKSKPWITAMRTEYKRACDSGLNKRNAAQKAKRIVVSQILTKTASSSALEPGSITFEEALSDDRPMERIGRILCPCTCGETKCESTLNAMSAIPHTMPPRILLQCPECGFQSTVPLTLFTDIPCGK